MNKPYFLIPIYNEANVIGHVLDHLFESNCRDIVIVNDGSTDHSADIIKTYQHITLIHHPINRGQGAALATGLDYLSHIKDCAYVVTFDADGQHQVDDALKMIQYLEEHADLDLLIGSRFIDNAQSNVPPLRQIILKLGVIFLRFIYALPLTDTHNGLRVIRKRAIHLIIPSLDDFSHASEILHLIKINNLKYQEYPTNILYSTYSLNKGQGSLNSINIALKTLWHKLQVLIFD